MSKYDEGTLVQWNWGPGTSEGKIVKIYTVKTTRIIKGANVTREASDDCPAYLIQQSDGDTVLKSHTEINKV